MEEGEYFGELGILHGQSKAMTAWCLQNTHYLTISKQSIEKVIQLKKQRIN